MKKIRILLLSGAMIALSFLFIRASDDYFEISKNLDIFASLYREINTNYVDETKPGNLMKIGIDAMLRSLDPYTNYIPESQIEDFRFMTTGQYGGIGALIHERDNQIIITETYDGFPAQKEGLLVGDRIVEIDGKVVKGKSTRDISDYLKGQPATSVKIKIERGLDGKIETIEKELARAEITILNVPHYDVLGEDVGYIKLAGFTQTASPEFAKAFEELRTQKKVKKLVIDLRGNGGGLLKESVIIVNNFVPKGTEIVKTKGKLKEWEQVYRALGSPIDLDMPLVILVDQNSASASEIVAGSLQDLDRAIIIGQETYGKGLVQQTVDLSYNSKLKVTVAKYYTPSGRCIQKLNYSDREEDGMVREVPDSMINEFKSLKYGRTLYDGNGIRPDIIINEDTLSNIGVGLLDEYLIFDFATDFRLKHDKIEGEKTYRISDETLNQFKEYAKQKQFMYDTRAEKLLVELKQSAEAEHYYDDVENEYNVLRQKLSEVKAMDFDKHREEIKEILSSEIVLRYYHQKGRLIHSLGNDPYVKEALAILNDSAKYQALLSGTK